MKVIKCQGKNCKKNGCYACGGYGEVLVQVACPLCKKPYWTQHGVHTFYEGKTFMSFDGVKLVYKNLGGGIPVPVCQECANGP